MAPGGFDVQRRREARPDPDGASRIRRRQEARSLGYLADNPLHINGLRETMRRARVVLALRGGAKARARGGNLPPRGGHTVSSRVRTAVRNLLRNPAHSVPAILTLGVGIGSVVSVYGIARAALWRPVPGVEAPGELLTIQLESTEQSVSNFAFSHPDLLEIRRRIPGEHAAYAPREVHFASGTGEAPVRLSGEAVTAGYFATLGVRMAAGRPFPDPAGADGVGARTVVIDHELWTRRWGGSPDAVGSTVSLNGEPFTVVGVAEKGFHGVELPGRARIWIRAEGLPALLHDPEVLTRRREGVWRVVVARPGASGSRARVEAELDRAVASIRATVGAHSFIATHLRFRAYEGIGVPPLDRPRVRRTLTILFAAAGLLLLLTCANVANLGLLRSLSSRTSTAVRSALGAGRARLLSERVIEHTLLGLAGGVLGLGVAAVVAEVLPGLAATDLELRVGELGPGPRTGLVTVAVALVAGLLSSLAPVARLRRRETASLLGSRSRTDRRSRHLGGVLVAFQVGLSTVLVVGAGLLLETVQNLRQVELGFESEGVVAFSLDPGLQGYDEDRIAALRERLLDRLVRSPRIEAAGLAHFPPFSPGWIPAVWRRPGGTDDDPFVGRSFAVTPSFFDVFGLSVRGPGFPTVGPDREDGGARTAIVNEAAADVLFPDAPAVSVVGRSVVPRGGSEPPVRIVGVVADARLGSVRRPAEPQVFRPWWERPYGSPFEGRFTAYVRTSASFDALAPELREIVSDLDPALPLYDLRALEAEVSRLTAGERFLARVALALGAVAVLLAALGLYSLLAHLVVERWREIGIRSALGALPRQVVGLVVGMGLRLALVGCGLGILGAVALGGLIESRLFGVAPLDPRVLGSVVGLLLLLAVLSAWIPARRALRLEVVDVLRSE